MSRSPRVSAIIQARMGSNRLPGKVLLELAGEPMLVRVFHRVQRAKFVDEVVIATTTEAVDDVIATLCAARGWACARGSQDDVLDRYYKAALERDTDLVVRITSDCPLIEPEVIDRVVRELIDSNPRADYACNFSPRRTFPRGLDVEAFWMATLKALWLEDNNPDWREHVTQFLHHHPGRFTIHGVQCDRDLSAMRWTVDTPEDLELIRRIYNAFGHDQFSWRDVLSLLQENPIWTELNRHVLQKVVQ